MNREELKNLGIEDKEIITAILNLFHTSKEEIENGKKTAELKNKQLQEQIDSLNATIEKFEGVDIEKLKKEVEDTKKESMDKINDILKEHAIKQALANVKHVDLLMPQINKDKIIIQDGKVVGGLSDQVEQLKTTYKDFFTPNLQGTKPASAKTNTHTKTKADILNIKDDAERLSAIQDNIELFTEY